MIPANLKKLKVNDYYSGVGEKLLSYSTSGNKYWSAATIGFCLEVRAGEA
jgi:hypothetical protein